MSTIFYIPKNRGLVPEGSPAFWVVYRWQSGPAVDTLVFGDVVGVVTVIQRLHDVNKHDLVTEGCIDRRNAANLFDAARRADFREFAFSHTL